MKAKKVFLSDRFRAMFDSSREGTIPRRVQVMGAVFTFPSELSSFKWAVESHRRNCVLDPLEYGAKPSASVKTINSPIDIVCAYDLDREVTYR